jgi:hypothetical protein
MDRLVLTVMRRGSTVTRRGWRAIAGRALTVVRPTGARTAARQDVGATFVNGELIERPRDNHQSKAA